MRAGSRAQRSVVVWLSLTAVGGLLLTTLPILGHSELNLRLQAIGLTVTSGAAPLALAISTVAAIVTIAARTRLSALPWPALQVAYGVLAALWTFGAVRARHQGFIFDVDSAYLGSRLDSLLSSLPPNGAAALVAVGSGLATVLLNASMQSLTGAVQARRFAPIAALSPVAGWYGDKAGVLCLLAAVGVLALSAMASERGRGLAWSSSLGLLSGLLLAAGALSGFAVLTAGIGMLCIYFLRRRSLMILVGGLGLGGGLLAATALGWSWPDKIGEASAAAIDSYQLQASSLVVAGLIIVAVTGPPLIESGRKLRRTPAWPLMLSGILIAIVGTLTRSVDTSLTASLAPAVPLLCVACVAPERAGGTPDGPQLSVLTLGAFAGLAATALCLLG